KRLLTAAVFAVFLAGCGEARYRGQPQSHWARQLREGDDAARAEASIALGKIGKPALPDLREALGHPDPRVRAAAASALGKMNTDAEDALPDLTERLSDPDPRVRASAAHAVGRIGDQAVGGDRGRDAIPALAALLADADAEVRLECAEALGRIGEAAAPAVPA